ncbi:acyltransferase family protein [Terriglobus aquaticus]|uniref:Acyltransferase family protein n=1 Tax=Terriglobus aquaticus TaxID=940139 RepID=A0ABW9KGQ1_9BACT|nr:acyltransferase [Terriglobus aquaticus]
MVQSDRATSPRSIAYKPELEGIRAIAFGIVFLVHYSTHNANLHSHSRLAYPWLLACQLSYCAVPIFFALSGYLITGVLLSTREKANYFSVFYMRRLLRIAPLYYAVLCGCALVALAMHTGLRLRLILLLVHLHNFWLTDDFYAINPMMNLGHFWSLAVEEQFYLLWPVAIFLVRNDRSLLRLCYFAIFLSLSARLAWWWWAMPYPTFGNVNSVFRCDALILGAILAISERKHKNLVEKLAFPAILCLVISCCAVLGRAFYSGTSMPVEPFGVAFISPLLSVMGIALVILAMNKSSVVHRVCSQKWAVSFGKRSYGLYVIHQLFLLVTLDRVIPWLARSCGRPIAHILGVLLALIATCCVAEFGYRFIELPGAGLKRYLPYRDQPRVQSYPTGLGLTTS